MSETKTKMVLCFQDYRDKGKVQFTDRDLSFVEARTVPHDCPTHGTRARFPWVAPPGLLQWAGTHGRLSTADKPAILLSWAEILASILNVTQQIGQAPASVVKEQ